MKTQAYKPVALFLVATFFGYQFMPIVFGIMNNELRAGISFLFGLVALILVGDNIFKWLK